MQEEKIKGLLQLANRAGKLTFGMEATRKSLLRGQLAGLFLAQDLGKNSVQKIEKYIPNNPPFFVWKNISKKVLSEIFNRNEIGIVGILDINFVNGIKKKLK